MQRDDNFFTYWTSEKVWRKVFAKKIFQMTQKMVHEDPWSMHITWSNETVLVSEIPYVINDEKIIIAQGQGKKTVSILSNEFCEEQEFPNPLPKGKFGYNFHRDIPICPAKYFNQRLLNFNQYFASDADILFARSVYEQHHSRSSTSFAVKFFSNL